MLSGRIDTAKTGKSGEIDPVNIGAVGNQHCRAGISQLITYFTLAVSWVEERGNGSGQRSSVIGSAEFPGVWQEDGDNLPRAQSSGDQAASERFDCISVFGIGEAASAGGIDEGDLLRVVPAGGEDQIVEEEVGRVGVGLGAARVGAIM